jgi:hypothetical protein
MASQQAVELVKAEQGAGLRSIPGVFGLSVQRRADGDFILAAFVDRAFPLPELRRVGDVEIVFAHEDRMRL